MKRIRDVEAILEHIKYKDNFRFDVMTAGLYVTLRVMHLRQDSITGEHAMGYSPTVIIQDYWTPDQIVKQAFRLILSIEEHEARETFRYKGKAILGPHVDVDNLLKIC